MPHFTVQAKPWEAQWRLERGDPKLGAADDELRAHGFSTNRAHDYWARVHEPDEYLDADDVTVCAGKGTGRSAGGVTPRFYSRAGTIGPWALLPNLSPDPAFKLMRR